MKIIMFNEKLINNIDTLFEKAESDIIRVLPELSNLDEIKITMIDLINFIKESGYDIKDEYLNNNSPYYKLLENIRDMIIHDIKRKWVSEFTCIVIARDEKTMIEMIKPTNMENDYYYYVCILGDNVEDKIVNSEEFINHVKENYEKLDKEIIKNVLKLTMMIEIVKEYMRRVTSMDKEEEGNDDVKSR